MRVTLITPTRDHAIDYYRGILPLNAAFKAGKCELEHMTVNELMLASRVCPQAVEQSLTADVIVIRGSLSSQTLKHVRDLHKELGSASKIVYDYDDNPFNVSPFNQSYGESGTEEVEFVFPDGTKRSIWVNGKNINIVENRVRRQHLKEALFQADMITTTTPELAHVLRDYNPNVKVLPNCLDLSRWNALPMVKNEIRVMWTGSASHAEEILEMKFVLEEMLKTFPQVKLLMVGYTPPGVKRTLPADRVEYHDWDSVFAYPYRLAALNADIALIPLRDTEFNRCKSPLKFLEMSALSLPSVVSYVTPYRELIDLAGSDDIAAFVEGFETHIWIQAIRLLVESVELRQSMGRKARGLIETHFDINKKCGEWPKAYASQVLAEVA